MEKNWTTALTISVIAAHIHIHVTATSDWTFDAHAPQLRDCKGLWVCACICGARAVAVSLNIKINESVIPLFSFTMFIITVTVIIGNQVTQVVQSCFLQLKWSLFQSSQIWKKSLILCRVAGPESLFWDHRVKRLPPAFPKMLLQGSQLGRWEYVSLFHVSLHRLPMTF